MNKKEEKAFKKYAKALNALCKNCKYSCFYRNHREDLKSQKIDHREVCCPREYDIQIDKMLKRKLK